MSDDAMAKLRALQSLSLDIATLCLPFLPVWLGNPGRITASRAIRFSSVAEFRVGSRSGPIFAPSDCENRSDAWLPNEVRVVRKLPAFNEVYL